MTSIIAIRTNSGPEGIVLGSDTQINYYDKSGALSIKASGGVSKIISAERWMMSYTGGIESEAFYKFTQIMGGDKRFLGKDHKDDTPGEIVRRSIVNCFKGGKNYDGPHFREVNELNTRAMRAGAELDDLPSFVLAAHFDRRFKGLWYVDEFGNLKDPEEQIHQDELVKDFEYIALGSGGEDIEKYLEKQVFDGKIEPNDINMKKAAEIVFDSLLEGSKDPLTGHVKDVAILTKSGVVRYGDKFKDELSEAEKRVQNTIIEDCDSFR